jgi:hypothetical protein
MPGHTLEESQSSKRMAGIYLSQQITATPAQRLILTKSSKLLRRL